LWACHIQKHRTTKLSPFFLTYGCEPKLPGDPTCPWINATNEEPAPELLADNALTYLCKLKEARQAAKTRLWRNAEADKNRWNNALKTEMQVFDIGDMVLLQHESKK
ncbi:hypothetical protein DFQ28_004500, partial [Apophysomyces sp. BC1034]